LALPHHVVTMFCSVLLHPELLGQRLVPPHRMLDASSPLAVSPAACASTPQMLDASSS
jgi:hypothetical protein